MRRCCSVSLLAPLGWQLCGARVVAASNGSRVATCQSRGEEAGTQRLEQLRFVRRTSLTALGGGCPGEAVQGVLHEGATHL